MRNAKNNEIVQIRKPPLQRDLWGVVGRIQRVVDATLPFAYVEYINRDGFLKVITILTKYLKRVANQHATPAEKELEKVYADAIKQKKQLDFYGYPRTDINQIYPQFTVTTAGNIITQYYPYIQTTTT